MTVLSRGIDVFYARLGKLPKELKQLAPFNVVSEKIISFRSSIPLYGDLKNEALRERHWRKLMEITEKTFDLAYEVGGLTLNRIYLIS